MFRLLGKYQSNKSGLKAWGGTSRTWVSYVLCSALSTDFTVVICVDCWSPATQIPLLFTCCNKGSCIPCHADQEEELKSPIVYRPLIRILKACSSLIKVMMFSFFFCLFSFPQCIQLAVYLPNTLLLRFKKYNPRLFLWNSLWHKGRRHWHPTPVLLPGKSHGWRSVVGYNPWSRKE